MLLLGVSFYNFLLFHTLVESFAIIVAILMGAIVWQTHSFSRNDFLTFLAIGYLWVGVIDTAHTLTYKGVHIFPDIDANPATQFWISARYVQAFVLIAAPHYLIKSLATGRTFIAFGLIAAGIVALIFSGNFPDAFIEGQGLTRFKIVSEYVIIGILLGALIHLRKKREMIDEKLLGLLSLSIVFTMCAEMAFTFYVSIYGLSNIVGHLFKAFAFWFLFVGIIRSTLIRPYLDLQQESNKRKAAEEEIRLAHDELRKIADRRATSLQEIESRHRIVLENMADGVITACTKGIIRYANPEARRIFGYSSDELIGRNLSMLMPEPDRSKHDSYMDAYHRTREAKIIGIGREVSGQRKDGSLFPLHLTVREIWAGGETVYLGTLRDITERKRAENLIRRERDLRQSVIDSLPGVFYVIDEGGQFLMWNQNVETVTGLSTEEMHMASPGQFFEGEGLRRIEESIARIFGEGKATAEAELISKDGTRTPYYFSGIRAVIDGRPCIVGTGIDISERREAETLVKKAKEQAEIANRTKSDFLANMSHELRTPLNAIIGFSDVMYNESFGPLQNPKYKSYSKDINASGLHLLDLINDILDVSVIEAGKLELRESEFDVAEIIESVARLINPKAKSSGVSLIYNVPSPSPRLRADSRRAKQILLNLLSNAIKFSPQNGTVTLAVTNDDGGGLSVSVVDHGIGMSREDIEEAVKPFGRTKYAYIREIEGTGLGLPLCDSLIKAHGGTLHVESAPGKGTTVTARFPPERVVRVESH